MITLGQIANSDYNLLGAISEDELVGAIERAPLAEKKQFVRRVQTQQRTAVAAPAGQTNSRGEFERRLHWLPKEIQQGLANSQRRERARLGGVNDGVKVGKHLQHT